MNKQLPYGFTQSNLVEKSSQRKLNTIPVLYAFTLKRGSSVKVPKPLHFLGLILSTRFGLVISFNQHYTHTTQ